LVHERAVTRWLLPRRAGERPNGRPAHQLPRGLGDAPLMPPMLGGHVPPGLERTPAGAGLHYRDGLHPGPRAGDEPGPRAPDAVAAALPDDVFGSEDALVGGGLGGGAGQRAREPPPLLPPMHSAKASPRPGGIVPAAYGNIMHIVPGLAGQGQPGQPPPRQDGSGGSRRMRGGGGGGGSGGGGGGGRSGGRGFGGAAQGLGSASRAGGRGGRGLADGAPGVHMPHGAPSGVVHPGGGRRHGGEDGAAYEAQGAAGHAPGPVPNPAREGGPGGAQGRGGHAGRGRGEGGRGQHGGGRGRGRERGPRGGQAHHGAHGQQRVHTSPNPGVMQAQPQPQWLPLPPRAVT